MTNEIRKPGRRPGKTGTERSITAAAQKLFAHKGFDRTTIRDIATEAKVDSALIMHFFGTKQQLFISAMFPLYKGTQLLPEVLQGDPKTAGHRLAALFIGLLEETETRQIMVGMIRSTSSEAAAADMVRELVYNGLITPISQQFKKHHKDIELRASLIGSQLVGLVMTRYIVKAPPIAQATPEELIQLLGPVIQKYLTD